MITLLFEDIQTHLSMLDLAVASSAKITSFAEAQNLDAVVDETENRERIVNIIGKIQGEIEEKINQLNAALLSNEDIAILKSWFNDLSLWSDKMISFDKITVEHLSQQKESTTKEIAHIFKNKEIIKGYNHSTKK